MEPPCEAVLGAYELSMFMPNCLFKIPTCAGRVLGSPVSPANTSIAIEPSCGRRA